MQLGVADPDGDVLDGDFDAVPAAGAVAGLAPCDCGSHFDAVTAVVAVAGLVPSSELVVHGRCSSIYERGEGGHCLWELGGCFGEEGEAVGWGEGGVFRSEER